MSHPTQTLRDKVWSVLNNVWTGDSEEDLYIKTDAILDLVREALLSGPAIQAGSIAVLDDESAACWECINEANKTTRPILRAALDAVTGEGDR